MKKALAKVNFQDLGVEVSKIRRTKTGDILIDVNGREGAYFLVGKLRDTIGNQARVLKLTRTTKVLVVNIADWLN